MTDQIHSNPDGTPDLSHYKPQYKINIELWRHYLKFKDTELTDKEVQAMADGIIKFAIDWMNRFAQHALDNEKEQHQKEKEERE